MALRIMRENLRHLKWIIVLVILSFIILLFLEWGAGGAGGRGLGGVARGETAVNVAGNPVPATVYRFRVLNQVSRMESFFGQSDSAKEYILTTHENVVNELISRDILCQEARNLGLEVSDKEVQDTLLTTFFGPDAPFDKERYKAILSRYGMTMHEYETDLRQDLLADKYRTFLQASVSVPSQEIEKTYRDRNERVIVDYALFRPGSMLQDVEEPSADEVEEHFKANQEAFRVPKQKTGALFVLNKDALRQQMEVTDEQLEAYYEANQEAFSKPEDQRRASHILFKYDESTPDEKKAELTEKIVQLRTRAKNGEDFANLAQTNSEDTGSAVRGGDLGWFGRGAMVENFEKEVFNEDNKVGDVVGPVFTQFGVHLIKITGVGGDVPPFHEVKPQVRQQYLVFSEEAVQAIDGQFAEHQKALDGLGSFDALNEYFTQNKLRIYQLSRWQEGDGLPRFGQNQDIEDVLMAMEDPGVSPAMPINDEFVVVGLNQIQESYLPDLAEVRLQVVKAIKEQQVEEMAFAKANQLLSQGLDLEFFQTSAEDLGAEAYQRITVTRDGKLGGMKTNDEFREVVFASEVDSVPPPVKTEEGVIAFLVRERFEFDPEKFAEEKATTRDSITQQRAISTIADMVDKRRESLESNQKIQVNQSVVDDMAKEILGIVENWS